MISQPKFGPLAGIKVVLAGSAIAGPFAAMMMGDYGADVISIEGHIEDLSRTASPERWEVVHRNQKCVALAMNDPKGQEILQRMVKDADILVENFKGGQFDRWGLTDDLLWSWNPKLVIAHISGYGQTGDPAYVSRGSYDAIGQAFGGMMAMNGEPDSLPLQAIPYVSDYQTAGFAAFACLAAYINAQKTGKGDSIDLAQFETCVYTQSEPLGDCLNRGIAFKRSGAKGAQHAGWQPFECKCGGLIMCAPVGPSVYKKGLPWLGVEMEKGSTYVRTGSGPGLLLVEKLAKFCAERTLEEADRELNANSIMAAPIMTHKMMPDNPHYKARETITEWTDMDGKKRRGPNTLFKFKRNPGKIWRPAPKYAQDNEDVLKSLGYSDSEISELYEQKTLGRKKQ